MYYTIYQTTNLLNGKKYIGKHITSDLHDSYLGSGMLLIKSIKKHGKENFKKEILFVFDNEKDMNEKEKEILTENILNNLNYYNIAAGGQGGAIVMIPGHPLYESTKKRLSDAQQKRSGDISRITKENHKLKKVGMYGKNQTEYQKKTVSEMFKGVPKSKESVQKQKESIRKTMSDPNYTHPNTGRKASPETSKKMSEAIKNRPKKSCPHCDKTLDPANFVRYHGDKCKFHIMIK
jgi:hypothetical protein